MRFVADPPLFFCRQVNVVAAPWARERPSQSQNGHARCEPIKLSVLSFLRRKMDA
jgi:hypothetical protein